MIHKASEATGFTDKLYRARRKLATDLDMKWGAYHFLHGADPVAEADHFLAVAEPDAKTLVALDWEDVPTWAPPGADKARAFLGCYLSRPARRRRSPASPRCHKKARPKTCEARRGRRRSKMWR